MPSAGPCWTFGPFTLDLTHASLWRGEQALALAPKAFEVLRYLVTHPNRLVTKDELLDAVWPETAVSEAVVRVAIGELRRALGDTVQAPRFIATVPRRGYRFLASVTQDGQPAAASPAPSALPQGSPRPPLPSVAVRPLVEREAVLDHLHGALAQARQGQRQVRFILGEPGIGKTAVVETFVAQARQDPAVWVATGQCIEHYGQGEPYMPVLEALGQLCRGPEGVRLSALLRQQAPTWLVQMPWLLTPADREHLQQELLGTTRERMLRELAMAVVTLMAEVPLVLVLEDLHWSDHATLDVLTVLAQPREPAQLLLVGIYRPVETIVHSHPLRRVARALQLHGQSTEIPLAPLSAAAVAAYLAARCPGGVFPAALTQWLSQCTEGNPLFVVNVVAHLIAHGVLVEHQGQWAFRGQVPELDVGVPETLRQMIAQQCECLAPLEQRVLAAGSVAGVEFTAAAVAACLDDEVARIEAHCEGLAHRGLALRPVGMVEWPDGTVTARYAFQHALYQQVVYEQLGAARRVHLHRQLGARLERAYGERAGEVAAELAEHFVQGRVADRAVQYLHQAADTARARHAHHDAMAHLTRALEVLRTLPDTSERRHQELQLLVALGASLMITRGEAAPEVEQAYSWAYALCQQVEDTTHLLPVLTGLHRFYLVRAAHQRSLELGERLLSLAERLQEPMFLLEAHRALAATRFFLGHFGAALAHEDQVITRYAPQPSRRAGLVQDMQVSCLAGAAHVLWCLGYPAQALARGQEAIAVAHHLAHPYSLVRSQHFVAELHQWRGELQAAQQLVETSLTLTTTQGFPFWTARGALLHGLIRARQGFVAEGIAQMQQGLEAMRTTGATLNRAYFLIHLAVAYTHTDHPAAGLACLIEATDERWWEAECHRLHGELLVVQASAKGSGPGGLPEDAEAETCFHRALAIARAQEAKSLELRAAMSLSRLWLRQGKRTTAHQLLTEVYGWFTEGFDTADLREAAALLETLAPGAG
jgi:DNA-binding winged helix-turn-helix (wHTH) protein